MIPNPHTSFQIGLIFWKMGVGWILTQGFEWTMRCLSDYRAIFPRYCFSDHFGRLDIELSMHGLSKVYMYIISKRQIDLPKPCYFRNIYTCFKGVLPLSFYTIE